MCDLNEAENLLKELEDVTFQPGPTDDLDGEKGSKGDNLLEELEEAVSQSESKDDSLEDRNFTLEAPGPDSDQEPADDAVPDGSLESTVGSTNKGDVTDQSKDGPSTLDQSIGVRKDTETMASSETMSAPASPTNVPEIVPNSETHVSEFSVDDDCNIVSIESAETSRELDDAEAVLVKEEMLPDVEEDEVMFNVSPTLEATLDPKFKPTVRLEKIDANSGRMKEESQGQESEDDQTNEDDGTTSGRPKRSIKTPSRLAGNFVLDPKAANAKSLQRIQAEEKISEQQKASKPTPVTSKPVAPKVTKIVKENITIRPKTPGAVSSTATDKGPTVTILKQTPKTAVKSPSKLPAKPVPGGKQGVSQEAKEIVRSLNADSVPTILKRGGLKRKAEASEGMIKIDAQVAGMSNTKTAPAKKSKVEPTPKPTRRHRKVFDYESYLRDHLEAEVNDKKPKSSTSNGEPFQLLSSLVGINIPPSKIKVLPFNTNTCASKTNVLRKTNENDSHNVERNNERTLYDLMQDLSNMLPSWNLHVLQDSNSFCIAQVCRGRSGIPTLKTSIELDAQFNAKVFIHQLHCKRYDGVYDSEESISALIQEIDALSK